MATTYKYRGKEYTYEEFMDGPGGKLTTDAAYAALDKASGATKSRRALQMAMAKSGAKFVSADANGVKFKAESGDLSFPEFRKIAEAFGYPYYCAHSNAEMKRVVDEVLTLEGPVFTEIFTDTKQVWEPKSSTKRLEDGTLVSPPLEDLAPFLPREELEKMMFPQARITAQDEPA